VSTVLECKNLSAGYLGRPVLRDFGMEVAAGEILAVLGPNGAGKTTLLLTLAGLLPSLGGSVSLMGHPVHTARPHQVTRLGLVLVPDDRALFTTLTTQENLLLGQRRGGMTIADVLAYFPALGKRLSVRAGALSGGEQQMLAVGRALASSPRLLLVDEMSLGLAPVVVRRLLPILRTIAREGGIGVLFSEQHVQLALDLADRTYLVNRGRIALPRTGAELCTRKDLVQASYLVE
jgi:branched-chain amino acid transport system ATP-binding protein